ncbi:hypothetical protein Cni_G25226 [Canna indica]|uniref:GrpE protein homolog n=1 Tax=Canna indica TaxID=4628 RepID=A0AAQ3QM64_9LILI|nr:hypothetical protein Cni_G25226 [Canna indica]
MAARFLSRATRGDTGFRLVPACPLKETLVNGFHSMRDPAAGFPACSLNRYVPSQTRQLRIESIFTHATFQRFGFSTASPQSVEHDNDSQDSSEVGSGTHAEKTPETPDAKFDVSRDDLLKQVAEKEELLKLKQKELEKMQDKVLRSYAEMENVIDRTKRESENSKKFAIQNFAKNLLDVADNLERASSVVKESFSKIDTSKDSVGAVPLLKTLLEGVEMTDKQLLEVFKKFGVEKFDPVNENFDPNKHLAVFQVPDASKPPGLVAAVLKSGYMLHDRIIRPAEVGVTLAMDSGADQNSS